MLNSEEAWKVLEALTKQLDKQFSTTNSLVRMGDKVGQFLPSYPTGLYTLDYDVIGCGGIPKGRLLELYGPECIAEDTFINYKKVCDGVQRNDKGASIARLYSLFHGEREDRKPFNTIEFTAPSINEEGRVIHNKIENVIQAGKKECFMVTTASGERIKASAEHKFLTAAFTWVALKDISIGDSLYIHNNTPFTKPNSSKWQPRHSKCVKYHPTAYTRVINGNTYCEIRTYRAVIEADMNQLTLDEYIKRLKSGDINGLVFLPKGVHVHHKDGNVANDSLDNLEVIKAGEHERLHAYKEHNNLRFIAVLDSVVSINSVGIQDTYDITMRAPLNNFVANRFVVHNSAGKTSLALHIAGQEQKRGSIVAYIDAEHSLDPTYANTLGVDMDKLLIAQPDSGEQAIETVVALVDSNTVSLIVVDSVAALTPQAELDGEIGDANIGLQARLMAQTCRVLRGKCNMSGVSVLFLNQIREKIGVMYGSNEVTPGGRSLKFYASVRLDVRRREVLGPKDAPIGHQIEIIGVKNKCGPPKRTTKVNLIYNQGIDRVADFITYAKNIGVIEQTGAFYRFEGAVLAQGLEKTIELIKSDLLLMERVDRSVQQAIQKEKHAST